jgi:predicted RNase H-like HicB family nuclease
MRKLKVVICKTNQGVSAHLPDVDGYVIARDSVADLKRDLRAGLQFHIEGLYAEERAPWMGESYTFEYVFSDIPSLLEAYNDFINQSSLARIAGINEGQMRQYAAGVKRPTKRTLARIEAGVRTYAHELSAVTFA